MANPSSIWAQIRGQAQPLPPDTGSVWAQPDVQTQAQPDTSALSNAAPTVMRAPTPLERQIQHDTGALQKVQWQQAHPWGTPENHPGKMGKVAHVFSTLGNIAGDIFAPEVMADVPGTQMHMNAVEGNLAKRLQGESKEASAEQEVAPRIAYEQAMTENLEHPPSTPLETSTGYVGYNPRTGDVTPIQQGGKQLMPYQKPGPLQHIVLQGPDGKPTIGFVDPQRGITYGQNGQIVDNPIPFEKPTAPQHITVMQNGQPHVMGADAEGNFTRDLGIAPPNYAQIAPELKTYQTQENGVDVTKTLGGKTLGVLPHTAQMRNMGEMAATVQPMIDNVMGEIQGLASAIGPAAGRWNQLMVNKGGADYPEFAGLDTDLDLLASAIVRTHFGARGGQQYREELRKMFGEAQSPEDLMNRIQHAEGWIEGYAKAGGVPQGKTQTGRPEAQPLVQMNKRTGAYRYSTDGGKTWQNGQPPNR